ncbi:hypothetical protein GUJ93_ZPchr0002g25756 [Zizania palustris]|uniref:Uncharacterized protein n=1 Tax=Zizania palustris TaxID=103762 RepID=A0A8J5VWT9_ZIZPA|nr:hypothetical protein GUJ93_ZPchr0002g25756 [Zizania palustris]
MDRDESAPAGTEIYRLPEECVTYAISMATSPAGDTAFHSSAVSPTFKAATYSDVVWDSLLPSDHATILPHTDRPIASAECAECASKKDLFACDRHVLLDAATMSFGLDRRSGAKCVMLSARALSLAWGADPSCWRWTTADLAGSRFPEVAELLDVCWLEITGKLQLSLLSPGTSYAAYLVFSFADYSTGLECNLGMRPPKATVTVVAGRGPTVVTMTTTEHKICLQHMGDDETIMHRRELVIRVRKSFGRTVRIIDPDMDIRCPRRREGGWSEVEMGEFTVPSAGAEEGVVEVSFKEESDRWKTGLIVQGIELRPKCISKLSS